MWAFLIFGVVFLIGLYLQWNTTYWKRRNVIGPVPLPIFGNMLNYLLKKQHYGEVYQEIYK